MLFGPKLTPLEKEWREVLKKEATLRRSAQKDNTPKWKADLEAKVPQKVLSGLQVSFARGFRLIFNHSGKILEKTYDPNSLKRKFEEADRAVMAGGRRHLRRINASGRGARLGNLAVTTAGGIGLGALGIGMPDLVLFLGMLLKGIYEAALCYGFDCDDPKERLLILKMMETSLQKGDAFLRCDRETEAMILIPDIPDQSCLDAQLQRTGQTFAADMLLAKFVQGLPLVGILGGAANPLYYNKVLRYVRLKYRKRYLRSVGERKGIPLTES